ncbi:MAG: transglutaminase-like domain-containing protein [Candidatus Cloacimonadota bacterium]|nr:transglutaminase-like domain-containing protein [Candidatus Cloacimonadota bacterium]
MKAIKRNFTKLLPSIILLFLLTSCSYLGYYSLKKITLNIPEQYRDKVIKAIKSAKKNKGELKKVLFHYRNDPKKLEAASFLIAYMPDHCFADIILVDSLENEIKFNVLNFNNYREIHDYLDSLEAEREQEFHWKLKEKREDIKTVSANFLISHVDTAFLSYETLQWTQQLGWQNFLEYVLPYRGSSEPISDWRTYFWNEFSSLRDSTYDPLKLACLINDRCKKVFTFKDVFYLHPTDLGLEQMLEYGLGRCEDMTNFTIYAMRANGLAVTSDYTPHWPDGTNNHAWNSLILPDGKVIPFMGCEANPGKYKLHRKIAKVYRKLFFEEEGSLASQLSENEKVPGWLSGKNYRDVTDKYVETTDVTLNLNPEKKWAYLAVFNSNKWKAIHWGKIDSTGKTIFTKMGKDIAYLPTYYEKVDSVKKKDKKDKYELKGADSPFILTNDGFIENFDNKPVEERLKNDNSFVADRIAKGDKYKIKLDSKYKLYIWAENDWQTLVDSITAPADSIIFDYNYPNSLYKLEDEDENPETRIFTIEQRKQKIW